MSDDPLFVVGLGASAGGLEVLQAFFDRMPADSGMAFVVIMHLSPDHESRLPEILQSHTAMVVDRVTDSVAMQADHVYVIAPNLKLTASDSNLNVSEVEKERNNRAPVDHFFRTLAEAHGDHAAAIILSGTGSNGSLGIRHVKERGGFVLVQAPDQANYDGMPLSAIATGAVDLVLPIEEMPERLIAYRDGAPLGPLVEDAAEDDSAVMEQILEYVRLRTGQPFNRYKRATIFRRLQRRMVLNGVSTMSDYLENIREDEAELQALRRDMLITVTSFFRDPTAFDYLERNVVPKLFEGKDATEQVRVWSVGCATGEEAYSLAMLLLEHKGRQAGPRVQVFASDIAQDAIARGREGHFHKAIANDISPERLARFFTQDGDGYRVKPELRESVLFAPHNVLLHPPFSRLDLISSRNLLIYLERDVQTDVADLFHYALNPSGYLFLSPAESPNGADLFRTVARKHGLYQRQNVGAQRNRTYNLPYRDTVALITSPLDKKRPTASFGALHHLLLAQLAPPSVLINKDHDIVYISDSAGRFLTTPGGEPTDNLFERVREEFRVALRPLLFKAFETGESVNSLPLKQRHGDEKHTVIVRAQPAEEPNEDFVLVLFDEVVEQSPARHDEEASDGGDDQGISLETELSATKEQMRGTVENYEATQEEMRAAFEELQSINEELQSTTEELQTGKEELQSVNEELTALGQENQNKVEELNRLNSDLQNLLSVTDIPTLFIDKDLGIRRFTAATRELFNIQETDKGRSLVDFTNKLDYVDLIGDVRTVIRTLTPIERELRGESGAWYLARILPYRSIDDRIEGAVATFVDISLQKGEEGRLQQSNVDLEENVTARNADVRSLIAALTLAEQRERSRIAKVLHDDVQQMLHALRMRAALLVREIPEIPEALNESIAELQELFTQALGTIRALTSRLSPSVLKQGNLAESLHWLVSNEKDVHGLEVDLAVTNDINERLSEDEHVLVFEVVRELLFNVIKHAEVMNANIAVGGDHETLIIRVDDMGVGFSVTDQTLPSEEHFGLASVRERLQFYGGSLAIKSGSGEGTSVTMSLPLSPEQPEPEAPSET
ncbi:MAG TPA: chemotaxis protein CheB [Trueperaceae bacterium]|nr:chemotaxis protein CheB [Trueperaceae bacterium]